MRDHVVEMSICISHVHLCRKSDEWQAVPPVPTSLCVLGNLSRNMSAGLGPASPLRAEIRVATPDHVLATWKNVVILVWRKETTVEGSHAAKRVYDNLANECPGGVFLCTIVEAKAPAPASDARKELANFLAGCSGKMIMSAVVHEGVGFTAAMVRSVVTGLALVAKLPYPHKVFATVAEGDAWFRANSPVARAWREGELGEVVKELRHRTAAR